MRCFYCDYSPTAPSLSSTQERPMKLYWDDKLLGWTCRDQCGSMDMYEDINDPYLREELVETYPGPPLQGRVLPEK
jgi:hypothetical protein